ncbi:T-cell immunomodulatory protein [Collichthys lucidus]|uniref:T-cell immunomodulatory protein n=1 Tax=Collichthys lucidus TaxID=240159 RepID=A0A4U5U6E3_COLLU|nr:T-cell immunomodulatory protein [Collichthys lucidus]
MWLFKVNILAFFLLFVGRYETFALQDVTADLFGAENYGTVAAFGDFHADKQTDIFIIRERSEVVILLADPKPPYFKPKLHITKDTFPKGTVITSVVPGDYDGDSQMDVLLTAQISSKSTTVFIFWGHNQTLDMSGWLALNKTFTDQPLIMDFNGDMVPDIFGVTDVPEVCYLTNRAPACRDALSPTIKLRVPHSNAFIDLNKDFAADLFLTTEGPKFETWINKDGNFTKVEIMPAEPPAVKTVGQSSFVDFDGDGYQDHLLPVCLDEGCQHSAIYLAKSGSKEWVSVLSDFQRKETLWSFVPGNPSQPLALHLGDYNLDGFPDALVVLRNTSGSILIPSDRSSNIISSIWRREMEGVLSGLCFNDCPEDVKLPYTVLGLGRSANFLDHLFVGIPRQSGETAIRKQEWTAIIPNSQLIVIPYPHNDPHRWSAKLYLTPSNSVLLTAIALIGVCVFILVIIGILHWQEKKADDREKRQEAHRFHFDAM